MPEEVFAFVRGKGFEALSDAVPELIDGSLGCLSKLRFEFGKGELDGIEVG